MRHSLAILCVIACLAAGAVSTEVEAATREQAVSRALAADGNRGKVLSVRQQTTDGRTVWAVKVLTDGRVRVHRIPAD